MNLIVIIIMQQVLWDYSATKVLTLEYVPVGMLPLSQALGKFHPHGDNAVYDSLSLVRMAHVINIIRSLHVHK
ncbi:hypothetical protein L1887_34705 [Cichorium endivia]|nr:hypothetical protein L1887_34705 [Cichorium endivia]